MGVRGRHKKAHTRIWYPGLGDVVSLTPLWGDGSLDFNAKLPNLILYNL